MRRIDVRLILSAKAFNKVKNFLPKPANMEITDTASGTRAWKWKCCPDIKFLEKLAGMLDPKEYRYICDGQTGGMLENRLFRL